MTTSELASLIGTTVAVREKGFAWFATILDAKVAYGSVRYQVTPLAGIGTLWVESTRTTSV